jgi:hypothetical protein
MASTIVNTTTQTTTFTIRSRLRNTFVTSLAGYRRTFDLGVLDDLVAAQHAEPDRLTFAQGPTVEQGLPTTETPRQAEHGDGGGKGGDQRLPAAGTAEELPDGEREEPIHCRPYSR